jgi:hypothetical protein
MIGLLICKIVKPSQQTAQLIVGLPNSIALFLGRLAFVVSCDYPATPEMRAGLGLSFNSFCIGPRPHIGLAPKSAINRQRAKLSLRALSCLALCSTAKRASPTPHAPDAACRRIKPASSG